MVKCFKLLRRKVLHKYRVLSPMKNSYNTLSIAAGRHNELLIYFFSMWKIPYIKRNDVHILIGKYIITSLYYCVTNTLLKLKTHYQFFLFLIVGTLETSSVSFSLLTPKLLQLFLGNVC